MADKRPVFTENFSANLTDIEVFLGSEGRAAYKRFLNRLFTEGIPTLCRFPQSGRPFLNHAIKSTKAETLTKDLRRLLGKDDEVREYIMDEHLILYLVRHDKVVFLSVKHHRQLSFDLKQFWLSE
jgi:hypothetical protein